MKKKYYKVVRKDYGGQLISSGVSSIEYKQNEWTIAPDNTRLFVFENLQNAKDFLDDCISGVIYECEVEGGIKGFGAFYARDQRIFWNKFNHFLGKKKKMEFSETKFGMPLTDINAVLCKKVKLTKKVV